MKKIAMYLAGSIKKDHEQTNDSYWTADHISLLRQCLKDYEISFLNPAFRKDDLSDQHSVFGRDMMQVFCSDVVFVDARERRGLGVGAEMMWAKFHKIPVITWAPKNSHYSKEKTSILGVSVDDFIHPFVLSLSDKIVDTLEEGAVWIHNLKSGLVNDIKSVEDIKKAMKYYQANQLHRDQPMLDILHNHEELKTRFIKS